MRKTLLASNLVIGAALAAPTALARGSEDDIGTRPAGAAIVAEGDLGGSKTKQAPDAQVVQQEQGPRRDLVVAEERPKDWYLLDAGLRTHRDTFIGLASLSAAQSRNERFYGALSLALIRNDAGSHFGAAQLGIGRNLSDEFGGVAQLSLGENRARYFYGLGQVTLGYNRSQEFVGALQLAGYNRADESFGGALQLGGYNRAGGDFVGLAQIGVFNAQGKELFEDGDDSTLWALGQFGVFNYANAFRGIAQIGGASLATDFSGGLQIGVVAGAQTFRGLAQIGAASLSERSSGGQLGLANLAFKEHSGLQLGGGNYAETVHGVQLGLANISDKANGVQIGLFNHAKRLRGVQIGLLNHAEDGVLEWSPVLNMGFEEAPKQVGSRR